MPRRADSKGNVSLLLQGRWNGTPSNRLVFTSSRWNLYPHQITVYLWNSKWNKHAAMEQWDSIQQYQSKEICMANKQGNVWLRSREIYEHMYQCCQNIKLHCYILHTHIQ